MLRRAKSDDPEPEVVSVLDEHVKLSPGGTHYVDNECLEWLDEQGIDYWHPIYWTGSFAIWDKAHAAMFKLRWG